MEFGAIHIFSFDIWGVRSAWKTATRYEALVSSVQGQLSTETVYLNASSVLEHIENVFRGQMV